MAESAAPQGRLAVRTLAMPADTNPSGDIFGGWLLAQMDIAAGMIGYQRAEGRVATVAVDRMSFLKPVYVGDIVSCYARIVRTGRSSITIHVESWALRARAGNQILVTQGHFTMVAINEAGQPRALPDAGSISV